MSSPLQSPNIPPPSAKVGPVAQKAAADDGGKAVNTVLARLVNLSETALRAESREKAGNLIVNQVHTLVKCDRALLVPLKGRRRIFCISGDLEPSQDNPFSQGVQEIRKRLSEEREPRVLDAAEWEAEEGFDQARKILTAMGGTRVLWVPLPVPQTGECTYALWLERWGNKEWKDEEIRLLSRARAFFSHALMPRVERKKVNRRKKVAKWLLLAVFIAIMVMPVTSRVSAPMQVVPKRPHYVFAPFDGIVEELRVQPGEKVEAGDVIFRYDTRILEKQLEETLRGGLAAARAELARLEGAAYSDQEARAKIPAQKLEVERQEAEVAFLRRQLALSEVRTDAAGVVVLDDPDALIGASLQTGQLVLRVADPNRTKLKVMVPVSDAGLVREGAPVKARLDSDPLRALEAEVNRVGFDVQLSDERVPSVFVESEWTKTPEVTPGQRGTARIEGPRMALGLQLFRKPLMALRTTLGI